MWNRCNHLGLGTEHFRPRDGLGAPVTDMLNHHSHPSLFLPPHLARLAFPLTFPLSPLSSCLKPGCRRHPDCPPSPPRAVETTVYATPHRSHHSSPRSGTHTTGLVVADFRTLPLSFVRSMLLFYIRSPALPLSFLFYLAHRTRDGTVAYLYINPLTWPRPSIRASSNLCNGKPHSFPLLARVPSPQVSRYARYDYPRAFSASRECGLSFSPLRLCFPFGIANPPWTSGLPFELTSMDVPSALHTLPSSCDTSEIAVRSVVIYIQKHHRLQISLDRSMIPNNVPYYFSTFGIQGWVQIFL